MQKYLGSDISFQATDSSDFCLVISLNFIILSIQSFHVYQKL